jgi:hypothetical protein
MMLFSFNSLWDNASLLPVRSALMCNIRCCVNETAPRSDTNAQPPRTKFLPFRSPYVVYNYLYLWYEINSTDHKWRDINATNT